MTTAVATTPAKTFRDLITSDSYKQQIASALPKGLTAERMTRVVLTALNRTPKLLECTKESLWQAVLDCAALGLFPDALGRAYLVPYKGKCQLIIGYKGLIDLMYRSDRIDMIQVGAVHLGDRWVYERGMHPKLEHTPCEAPGPLTHVYTLVHLKGCGMPSIEVMGKREVDAIRARSMSRDSGPWVTDYEAMAIKTCIRRHSKVLPMSSELAQALDTDANHDPIDPNAAASVPAERFGESFGGTTTPTTAERVPTPEDVTAAYDRAAGATTADQALEAYEKATGGQGITADKIPAEGRAAVILALNDLAGVQ